VLFDDKSFSISQLLLDTHVFFMSTSPDEWKKNAPNVPTSDTPSRSVKTILHEIALKLDQNALKHTDLIQDPSTSHAVNYLTVFINNERRKKGAEQVEVTHGGLVTAASSSRTSPSSRSRIPSPSSNTVSPSSSRILTEVELAQKLTEILKKVSDKELTKVGIQELYSFRKKYPQAEGLITMEINKKGTYFQGYINRQLKTLAQEDTERVAPKQSSASMFNLSGGSSLAFGSGVGERNPYEEKLRSLQRRFDSSGTPMKSEGTLYSKPTDSLTVKSSLMPPMQIKKVFSSNNSTLGRGI
jgi:cytoskeleton-associated protein 5